MFLEKLFKAISVTAIVASSSFALTDGPFSDLPVLDYISNPTDTIGQEVNWRVTGMYKVPSGCVLTIRPGTWIFGTSGGSVASRSAVIAVLPGGKIIAEGKADSTIVMTCFGDDKNDPTALGPGAKGLWGGLVILGNAPVSTQRATTRPYAEGVLVGDPDFYYGGNDANDNSGSYKYLSVRHGGASIPFASEINGITFFGVGAGTTVDYVEVYANFDDGFDFFGGNVNCKHLISAFNNDDHFDLDDGYSGKGQFLFSIESEYEGNRGCEFDGKQKGDLFTANPKIYNATLIGSGRTSANNYDDQIFGNHYMFCLADSIGGTFNDMIILDGPERAAKAWSHKVSGPLPLFNGVEMKSNIYYNLGMGTTWRDLFRTASSGGTRMVDTNYWFKPGFEISNPIYKNGIADPKLNGISRTVKSALLDPRPRFNSPALNPTYATTPPADGFFTPTNYIGAFDATSLWASGWSKLSTAKILTSLLKVTVSDQELVWTNGGFHIRTLLKMPGASIQSFSVKVNGVVIDPAVFARTVLPESHFISDGFRVPGYNVRDLYAPTGVNYGFGAPNNNYLVEATYTLTDGTVLKDSATWKISN